MKPFTTPETAAETLEDLSIMLRKEEREGRYAYRGQTREYPVPLLPSAVRPFFSTEDVPVETSHPLARYSLRKCGAIFYGDHVYKVMQSVQELFSMLPVDEREGVRAVYDKAMKDSLVAVWQLNNRARGRLLSWTEALNEQLTPAEQQILSQNAKLWQPSIDRYHRRIIRMLFFQFIFGYFVGTILSQQYGLSSELLDATADLDVALFFATHDHQNDYVSPIQQGTGIIYRFPVDSGVSEVSRDAYSAYYSLPSMIDAVHALKQCAAPNGEDADLFGAFYRHCASVYNEAEENALKWRFPEFAFERTRVWHQKAVVILPDELRKDVPGKRAGVGGITVPAFQYIEDIAFRVGTEKFYFKQTGRLPAGFALNREYLWPRDDPLIPLIASGMTCLYPVQRFSPHYIPYRLDLIDAGYDEESFHAMCKVYASYNPLIFWDDDSMLASKYGVVVI
jgi:hypothetical protein